MITKIEEMIEAYKIRPGTLHVITGGMKGNKTVELLSTFASLEHTDRVNQLFKPQCDYREDLHKKYGVDRNHIVSRTGMARPALEVDDTDPEDLLRKIDPKTEIIGIGEVTLFEQSDKLVGIVLQLMKLGKAIIVDGLDRNFRGEPYDPMPALLCHATTVQKFYGNCDIRGCNNQGEYPQRLIGGQPDNYNSPIKQVGEYEIRCLKHHEIPGKPELKIRLTLLP